MKKLWCLPLLWFALSNCTKDPLNQLTNEGTRIYVTNYDTSVRFSNYSTFAIADSVAVISNNQLQGKENTPLDLQFVNAVVTNLQKRGYQRVDPSQNPDLEVAVSIINNTSTQMVDYTDYGAYYDAYWDPSMYGYPDYSYYFPSYYGTVQSNETDLGVDAFDLKNAKANNQLRDVWSGLIRGEDILNAHNVDTQMAALFNQSPYFKK